jgi:ligand-binding sensor domain-containing protein/signal transduction histidine kinase
MPGRSSLLIAACALVLSVGGLVGTASGERLPVRRYTTADGLAGDYIVSIYRDSRGFLWFSTRDGLSRFDGVRFTTYGVREGLPSATINRVLETRDGTYWIGTNGGGVCRFNPLGSRPAGGAAADASNRDESGRSALFVPYRIGDEPATNRVNVLHEDREGHLWVGTDAGLFRLEGERDRVAFRRVELPLLPADRSFHGVGALAEDSEGSLWIGGGFGLRRRLPDGRVVVYRVEPKDPRHIVDALLFVKRNQLWVGSRNGLLVIQTAAVSIFDGASHPIIRTVSGADVGRSQSDGPSTNSLESAHWYTSADGLPYDHVNSLYLAGDGRIWAGTIRGVGVFDGGRFRSYTTADGLTDNYTMSIVGDGGGNLWIGTVAGVTRMIPHGLVTYDEADGLGRTRIYWLGQSRSGDLFAVSGDHRISRFDGKRFETVRPDLPPEARCAWTSPCGYLDRTGEWWMLTEAGLYRFPKVTRVGDLARLSPRAIYTAGRGLPSDNVFRVFEDRQNNIWIGTAPGGLVRWERASGAWREYSEADGMPPSRGTASMVSAFAEDRTGTLWVGFHDGGVGRLRNGRFELFGAAERAPLGLITALYLDAAGRLWIGSSQAGLTRVDEPGAARPVFTPMPSDSGLTSANVRCVTEDASGRIYAGTSRGIHRLDPATGRVKHFGAGEGLASEFVTAALRDAQGMLWFGTISGLSRLDPTDEASRSAETGPARVLISAIRVRGTSQRISELGDPEPGALTLGPDQNQMEIEFFEPSFDAGESLKYQYRLEGTDAGWSPPTELRSVNYGRLPSGSHQFLVRSVRSGGAVSTPAIVSFTVLPPIYARWWFISLAVLLVGAAVLALYRVRVAQLLRVERVRARIATDLHDDIGASLSQIAILAEVAQQVPAQSQADPDGPLALIADTSRGLVDSMSDIVWAINPEVDSLSDLVHRMRRFAEDTLSVSDIDLTFRAPELRQDPTLGPEIRRELFLILKESVTNIAKHAECKRVTIELESDRRRLRLRVTDDGKGFEPAQRTDGNGLANMRRRVAALAGRLSIQSKPGAGTTIELDVPLRPAPALGKRLLPH